jgi:hypothetical protein
MMMTTIEFFDYLVASDATHDLGLELADAWAERHFDTIVLEPAA